MLPRMTEKRLGKGTIAQNTEMDGAELLGGGGGGSKDMRTVNSF